ncbi:MAG: glycosyltransferase family 1 protein, partial [Candidatus Levyibacteriota bacterium]
INGYEAVVPRFGFNEKTGLPNRVGSGEVSFEILKKLYDLDKKNSYRIYLPAEKSEDLPKERDNWSYINVKNQKIWTATALSKKLFEDRRKLDVFFSPTHYLPLYVSCPSAVAILDLSYIHFPGLFKKKDLYQLKLWGKYSVKKASKIITISEASKNDIIKYYKVSSSKVAVVYPGIKEMDRKTKTNIRSKYQVEGDFILFVGTLQPRKNVSKLIESLSEMEDKDIKLVVVGKRGWMFEDILKAPGKYGVSDRVKFLENVSDQDLPSFYSEAKCFVLPSLYEGFGLPVLEAMQNGCPVIASKVSSLPEAGGDAALYINPQDSSDIAQKIDKVLKDDKLAADMVRKGFEQVKKFSWEKSATKTLQVLESLVERN